MAGPGYAAPQPGPAAGDDRAPSAASESSAQLVIGRFSPPRRGVYAAYRVCVGLAQPCAGRSCSPWCSSPSVPHSPLAGPPHYSPLSRSDGGTQRPCCWCSAVWRCFGHRSAGHPGWSGGVRPTRSGGGPGAIRLLGHDRSVRCRGRAGRSGLRSGRRAGPRRALNLRRRRSGQETRQPAHAAGLSPRSTLRRGDPPAWGGRLRQRQAGEFLISGLRRPSDHPRPSDPLRPGQRQYQLRRS